MAKIDPTCREGQTFYSVGLWSHENQAKECALKLSRETGIRHIVKNTFKCEKDGFKPCAMIFGFHEIVKTAEKYTVPAVFRKVEKTPVKEKESAQQAESCTIWKQTIAVSDEVGKPHFIQNSKCQCKGDPALSGQTETFTGVTLYGWKNTGEACMAPKKKDPKVTHVSRERSNDLEANKWAGMWMAKAR